MKVLVRPIIAALLVMMSSGAGSAAIAPAPPAPPSSYTLPVRPVLVGNSAELEAAVASGTPQDIVLRDGVYRADAALAVVCGHRLYAEHSGRAVLTVGLSLGSDDCAGGGRVQGLAFDLQRPAGTAGGAAIEVWGTARGTVLADITIDGHRVADAGILARQPEGLKIQRVVARNFLSWGVFVDADEFDLAVVEPPLLEDIDVVNVGRAVPGSSDGTAEACIWVGNTATGRRFRVRHCAWMGLWTGTAAKNALFSDVDIDDIGSPRRPSTGLYLEHFTTDTTFERIRIGPNVTVGVECEWADPAWDSRPGCDGVVIQDSLVHTRCVGVYLDDGTRNTTVRRTAFVAQQKAAIATFNQQYNLLFDTSGNDYSGMQRGARVVLDENDPC